MSITPLAPRIDALPALARPVSLRPSLAYHVGGDTRLGDGTPTLEQAESDPRCVPHLSPTYGRPSRADIEEAARKLTEAEHQCRPVQPATIAAWCKRLRTLPFSPQDEAAAQPTLAAIAMACGELPTAVWTSETAVLALRTFKRWPAPAEVYAFMSEQAQPFLRARDGLRRVAAAGEPASSPQRAEPPADATAHVAMVVRAFAAERSFNQHDRAPDRVVVAARPVSLGVLLAVYEQAAARNQPGAAIRLAMLRKQIPDPDEAAPCP